MSDHKGARLMLGALPPAKTLIADRGYDSVPFRQALAAKGIAPCIPSITEPEGPVRLRRGPLSPAPQDREHVRQAQGLAPHRHPLRPLRPHLLLGHLYRCRRRLLSQSMSPEPRQSSILGPNETSALRMASGNMALTCLGRSVVRVASKRTFASGDCNLRLSLLRSSDRFRTAAAGQSNRAAAGDPNRDAH